MTADDRLTLGSSIVFLALAGLAAVRARREPLAVPLGALYLDLFAYDVLDLISSNSRGDAARWFNAAAAALAVPLAFEVVATFVGRRRRLRWVARGIWAYFLAIAITCVSPIAFASPRLNAFALSPAWGVVVGLGLSVALGVSFVLLARHLRESAKTERSSAWLVTAAVALGVGGSGTDVFAIAGAPVPRLAAWGLLASGVLLAAGTLRFRLVRDLTPRAMATSIAIALGGVVAQLGLARSWGAGSALLVLASVVVTLAVWGALRHVAGRYAEGTARMRYHATLGRFAAQMAHDVRNPLAAARGAAQLLLEEHAQGRPLEDGVRYLHLIVEQTDRITQVVDRYQRLGRVEASLARVDLTALLGGLVEAQRLAMGEGVTLTLAIEPSCPDVRGDAELLASALENLVRNANEAMPKGGAIRVGAERRGDGVVIWVEDEGEGMDAVTRENAQDDFFTTKTTGSGLGLALVRRVAEVHDATLSITSAVGRGTRVDIHFSRAEPTTDVIP
ncbi:MAG: HAMP domain-containing histidine kinase [Myxococcales bacterium]|jgi:signal transduction histidine kinase|nr:HAMP domain-containing histidine kinase [Myxococcales bacterium]